MDRASRLIGNAFRIVDEILVPGCTTLFIADTIERYLTRNGADQGMIIQTSPEDVAWHGLPDGRILKEGEIVTVDVACSIRGWWADSARTFPIGRIDEKRRNLLRTAWEGTRTVIDMMKEYSDGVILSGKLASLCADTGTCLVEEGAGHGIGQRLHEAPALTYDGRKHEPIEPGRVYTAEPIFSAGDGHVIISSNGYAVTRDGEPTAHFEATVLLVRHGRQVLGAPDWLDIPPC